MQAAYVIVGAALCWLTTFLLALGTNIAEQFFELTWSGCGVGWCAGACLRLGFADGCHRSVSTMSAWPVLGNEVVLSVSRSRACSAGQP